MSRCDSNALAALRAHTAAFSAHTGTVAMPERRSYEEESPEDPASAHNVCWVAVIALLLWLAILLFMRTA
jgi:hypothetical protein